MRVYRLRFTTGAEIQLTSLTRGQLDEALDMAVRGELKPGAGVNVTAADWIEQVRIVQLALERGWLP